jgi:TusA-related sulfurtransferase
MTQVDVRGLSCPLPVMQTKKALDASAGSGLVVLADSGTAKANIVHLLEDRGFAVNIEESDEEYRIVATKN